MAKAEAPHRRTKGRKEAQLVRVEDCEQCRAAVPAGDARHGLGISAQYARARARVLGCQP